jgi:arylsulfatase A-like enzyme
MAAEPNVLVFFSDQQRWDTVSAYAREPDLTPYFDWQASDDVRFEYAFTCQPVYGPAQ